jgi:hypothetical protein
MVPRFVRLAPKSALPASAIERLRRQTSIRLCGSREPPLLM